MISCDTSFLHSLYLIDSHTQKARTRLRQIEDPEDRIALSPFHRYELPNAIRLSVFRGLRDGAAGEAILAAFQTDLKDGRFELPTCNLASVLIEAERLSSIYTASGRYRAFDILYVAAALQFGSSDFLTFDTKQSKLALAVGLRPWP
jgi:predicted nucleic acid-binding protein